MHQRHVRSLIELIDMNRLGLLSAMCAINNYMDVVSVQWEECIGFILFRMRL